LTISDLPNDWQASVISAGKTWTEAGSNLTILSTTTLLDSQRHIIPLDLGGEAIEWFPLAACEIRVVTASDLPDHTLANTRNRTSWAGWAQIYADPSSPQSTLAALVVLNDLNANWATGDLIPVGRFDVQTIALHELGHAIGLPHVDDKNAIMSGEGSEHLLQWLGFKKRDLTDVDIGNLQAIYGSR
jgi:hypothetical protein